MSNTTSDRHRVVIIGGGFGGLPAARLLGSKGKSCDVLLVDALPAHEHAGHDALADRLVGEVDDARHAEPLLGHRGQDPR